MSGFPVALLACTALQRIALGAAHHTNLLDFGPLPAELFQRCTRLRRLQLLNSGATAVPPEVACASALTELVLLSAKPGGDDAAGPRVALPPQLSCLRSLARLELSAAEVPDCVFRLSGLTALTLDQAAGLAPTQLRRLAQLTNLAFLRLCQNPRLPAALAAADAAGVGEAQPTVQRVRVQHLCLDGNELEEVGVALRAVQTGHSVLLLFVLFASFKCEFIVTDRARVSVTHGVLALCCRRWHWPAVSTWPPSSAWTCGTTS